MHKNNLDSCLKTTLNTESQNLKISSTIRAEVLFVCLLNVRNRNYFPMTLSQQLNVIPTINPNDGRNTPTKQKLLLPSIFVLFFLSFFCFLNFLSESPGCVITLFFISSCIIYSFLCKFIIQLFYFLNTVPFYIFF